MGLSNISAGIFRDCTWRRGEPRNKLQCKPVPQRSSPYRCAVTFLSFNWHRDFRIEVPPLLRNEQTTIEMLKDPTRRSNLGLEPSRRILHYFTNPLGEDAKIAVQSLPRKIKKLKTEKPKKKAKKPKKKKRVPLPKSELKPDSHVKPTPLYWSKWQHHR